MIGRVDELRRFMAGNLTCTGTVNRVTGVTVDPLTGIDTPTLEQVYSGPCLVYPNDYGARDVDIQGAEWIVSRYSVTLPHGASVKVGDLFTATSSPHDADLVGEPLRLVDVPLNAWEVATTCTAERVNT